MQVGIGSNKGENKGEGFQSRKAPDVVSSLQAISNLFKTDPEKAQAFCSEEMLQFLDNQNSAETFLYFQALCDFAVDKNTTKLESTILEILDDFPEPQAHAFWSDFEKLSKAEAKIHEMILEIMAREIRGHQLQQRSAVPAGTTPTPSHLRPEQLLLNLIMKIQEYHTTNQLSSAEKISVVLPKVHTAIKRQIEAKETAEAVAKLIQEEVDYHLAFIGQQNIVKTPEALSEQPKKTVTHKVIDPKEALLRILGEIQKLHSQKKLKEAMNFFQPNMADSKAIQRDRAYLLKVAFIIAFIKYEDICSSGVTNPEAADPEAEIVMEVISNLALSDEELPPFIQLFASLGSDKHNAIAKHIASEIAAAKNSVPNESLHEDEEQELKAALHLSMQQQKSAQSPVFPGSTDVKDAKPVDNKDESSPVEVFESPLGDEMRFAILASLLPEKPPGKSSSVSKPSEELPNPAAAPVNKP